MIRSRERVLSTPTQSAARALFVAVRGTGSPAALAETVRREIAEIDPDLPVSRVSTMEHRVDQSLARRRFSMLVLSLFAVVAFVLASIGIYGVIAYLVSQSNRELAIRMALGAAPRSIRGLILRQGLSVALVGVVLGLAGAAALTRLMQSLLFGIGATDGWTFTMAPLVVTLVALLASYIPATRAMRIDPMVSLRNE